MRSISFHPKLRRLQEREDGFSLVEMVIAMALIGLITVIAIPVLQRGTSTATDVRVQASAGLRIQKDVEYLRANPSCSSINAMISNPAASTVTIPVGSNRAYLYNIATSNGVTTTPIKCVPGRLITVTFTATTPATGSPVADRSVQLFTTTEVGANSVLP